MPSGLLKLPYRYLILPSCRLISFKSKLKNLNPSPHPAGTGITLLFVANKCFEHFDNPIHFVFDLIIPKADYPIPLRF